MTKPTVKRILRSLTTRLSGGAPSSVGLEPIDGLVTHELTTGWQDQSIAERQHMAFADVLRDLREGRVRQDFKALAAAVAEIDDENPRVIEIGSGSGWNAEVLSRLLKRSIRYIGMDYSEAMTTLGRRTYPELQFAVGDATELPFADASCDVVIFGTVLMHVADYSKAVAEGRRIAAKWAVFHTIPTIQNATRTFRKLAYGVPVVEIVFGQDEFRRLCETNGFKVCGVFESLPHPYLNDALHEKVAVRTYLCRTC